MPSYLLFPKRFMHRHPQETEDSHFGVVHPSVSPSPVNITLQEHSEGDMLDVSVSFRAGNFKSS